MLVKFDNNGFYHSAFGRMGTGRNAGKIYDLPDIFKATGMLPKTAEIMDGVSRDELEDMMLDAGQKRPVKPTVVDEVQLAAAKKRAQMPKKRKSAVKKAEG